MTMSMAEIDRRLAALVQVGQVTAVDNSKAAVRVQIGDLVTPWLKVAQLASGTMRIHVMPSVGEAVSVVAPSGEMAHAYVTGAIPTDAAAIAPDAGQPTMDLGGGTLRIVGDLWVDGNVRVTGDVVAGGAEISLVTHKHSGVVMGPALTGLPT